MQKKLRFIGNRLGHIIDRPILEFLRIDKETPLDVSTDGEALNIRPVRLSKNARIRASIERVTEVHAATFAKLAR